MNTLYYYSEIMSIQNYHSLMSIYRLGTSKNDPEGSNFNKMVELVGTAPTSAGLSWLVFYRLSSF
jgi:hypothetical protein